MANGLATSEAKINALGFPSDLFTLRLIDAQALNTALSWVFDFTVFGGFPSTDGYVIEDDLSNLYNSITPNNNILNSNEITWGFASVEGITFFGEGSTFTSDLDRYNKLLEYFTDINIINDIIDLYPSNIVGVPTSWAQMNGDICVICPTYNLANLIHNKKGEDNIKQYLYEFRGDKEPYLPTHNQDNLFYFGLEDNINPPPMNVDLSNYMINELNNFVNEGKMNKPWKQFNGKKVFYIDNVEPKMDNHFINNHNSASCSFWENIPYVNRRELCGNNAFFMVNVDDPEDISSGDGKNSNINSNSNDSTNKTLILSLVIPICILLFIGCIFGFGYYYRKKHKLDTNIKNLQKDVQIKVQTEI